MRVSNVPQELVPTDVNRKLQEIFTDLLFEDEQRHADRKGETGLALKLPTAEGAIASVTVQHHPGARANIAMCVPVH